MKNSPVQVISCDFENKAHCEALVCLMSEYIADKMGGGAPYTEEQKIRLVEGLKNHPAKLVYLAEAHGGFVGLVNCFVNFATFTVKPFINIHDVIVTAAWRGNGIGRKMLEKVLETADGMDCSKVTLEVREDNQSARALYNSLGFMDADPRQFYWAKFL
jgi:ribosomal protein S18 acetylase RimI-like enzyme